MKIYIADCNHGFFDPEIEEAKKHGVDLILPGEEKCSDADVLVVQRQEVDDQYLNLFPNCKIITRYGVGLDNVDCNAAKKRNIKVINFPGFCTEEVANHALAGILFCYRQLDIIFSNHASLSEWWGNPGKINSIKSAKNTIIGVLGAGRIGGAVIERCRSCGFSVLYCDPFLPTSQYDHFTEIGASHCSFNELLSNASILTIHVPLNGRTKGMINESSLQLMNKGSCIVNTARGSVIISNDLIQSLDKNIRCSFVDVFDPEPLPSRINHTGMRVTPHCAFYSWNSLDRLKRGVVVDSVKYHEE